MTLFDYLALTLAGVLGGALNTAAAGGGVITFVTCLAVGLPAQAAIATSQVAIPASFLGGVVPAWRQRARYRPIVSVVIAAAVGTALGVVLISRLDAHTFRQVAPWLLVVAGALLIVQPFLTRWLQRTRNRDLLAMPPAPLPVGGARPPLLQPASPPPAGVCELERREPADLGSRRRRLALALTLFVVALYGGGFGGGVGVAVLVALATMTGWTWETTNTVKIGLCLVMSIMCSGAFLFTGLAHGWAVVVLMVGQLVGGRLGVGLFTWAVRRFSERTLRRVVGAVIVLATAFGAVAVTGNS